MSTDDPQTFGDQTRRPAVGLGAGSRAPAGRHAETGLDYAFVDPSDIPLSDWRAMARRVIAPSIFCDPLFVRGLRVLFPHMGIQALTVRDPMESDALKSIWLTTFGGPFKLAGLQTARTVATPYSPLGVPLIASDAPWRSVETALDAIAQKSVALTLDTVPLDGEFMEILTDVTTRLKLSTHVTGRRDRAVLIGGRLFKTYSEKNWSSKRRAKLRRCRRKLDEKGLVTFHVAGSGSHDGPGIDAFLKLEASGWKGEARTALASNDASQSFFRETIGQLMATGAAEIHSLCLDAAPIAMFVVLRQNGQSWTWKIAYDETCGAFMPGSLLMEELTRRILSRGDIFADSCTTEERSLADDYWVERVPMGQVHIALSPGRGQMAMLAAAAVDAAHDGARHAFRALRG